MKRLALLALLLQGCALFLPPDHKAALDELEQTKAKLQACHELNDELIREITEYIEQVESLKDHCI